MQNDFKVPESSILVAMDIKALYKTVPNNEGIAAVKQSTTTTQRKL